jgi:hypothetical protein
MKRSKDIRRSHQCPTTHDPAGEGDRRLNLEIDSVLSLTLLHCENGYDNEPAQWRTERQYARAALRRTAWRIWLADTCGILPGAHSCSHRCRRK